MTIYLHRGLAHGSIEILPIGESIFKFLLWITRFYFENYIKILRAQHYIHHAYSDSVNDIHSPHHYNVRQLLDIHHNQPGRPYYVSNEDIEKHSKNIVIKETWLDINLYKPYQNYGWLIWIPIIFLLFGAIGAVIGFFLIKYISEVHTLFNNYFFHKWGYGQNDTITEDKSKNIFPIGILLAGEELHNNHHNNPKNVKFSQRWFEFDLGWVYILLLSKLKVVKIKSNT
jgi:stearoyl-CoA desaturase (delta-9 desaturase)